ncbi:hypothetical protein C900_00496 [Fulvivirga imtechensis AK7]|uniref:Uncharacterized protein n=1 Tax=Fulvivirga imtechensis AK7 TaxID=1237149 RepID=L8JZA9_9BACT|nr:hypothetical protein C900_00496 [Fulvivirga imtechensis AK7]
MSMVVVVVVNYVRNMMQNIVSNSKNTIAHECANVEKE